MVLFDGGLLARKARHRVANDLGGALGALRLVSDGLLGPAALAAAVSRLEAAADINRALCVEPVGAVVQLAPVLERLRLPLARAAGLAGWSLRVSVAPIVVVDRDALCIAMIVHELVSNALRHAGGSATRMVDVAVTDGGGLTTVVVTDGNVAGSWTRPGGQGARIVDALAAGLVGRVVRPYPGAAGGAGVLVELPSLARDRAMHPGPCMDAFAPAGVRHLDHAR